MRVYCRFAPPCALATSSVEHEKPDAHASLLPPPMLLLSLRGDSGGGQHTVILADPRTGSMASSTCRRVFLPPCMPPGVGGAPLSTTDASPCTAKGKNQQEELFDEIVRPLLGDLISGKPCTFLAYGQTATGKTYTMFGPNAGGDDSAPRRQKKELGIITRGEADTLGQEEEEEEEGIVPRLLRAIFVAPGAAVEQQRPVVAAVDLSCLEVYNECVTDLVALLLQQHSRKAATFKKKDRSCGAVCDDVVGEAAWQAWLRYEQRGRPEEGRGTLWSSAFETTAPLGPAAMEAVPQKVMYRATEKAKVMRSVLRLRCESAAECGALLREVLALRNRSQTERNLRSSRSHLVLRLGLRGAAEGADPIGESVFVDLAGSETYRDQVWAAGDVATEYDAAMALPSPLQASLTDAPLAASTFTSNRCDSSGLTAVQRGVLRTCEMRHINVSLLALRKVVRALQAATASASSTSSSSFLSSVRRVPFRDSMLTTILEPFLTPGAASAVTWVVCCSCRQCDFHETVESLRLGAEAAATATCVQLCPPFPFARVAQEGDRGSVASSNRGTSVEALVGTRDAPPDRNVSQADIAATGPVIQRGRGKTLFDPAVVALSVEGSGGGRCRCSGDTEEHNGSEGEGRDELAAYKQYALQLLEQCTTLCERYDECVGELVRTKQAMASRDREIDRLRKALTENGGQQKLLEGPASPPLPTSIAPDENLPPEPPAWLRKGVMSSKRNDIASLLCGSCAVQKKPSPVVTSEAVDVVGAGAEEVAAAAAEEDLFVESILKRCCVQHDPAPVACKPSEASVRDGKRNALLLTPSVSTTIATTSGEVAAPSESAYSMRTPHRTGGGSSSLLKGQNRREHVVSFVSPSSHGAVPLTQLAENRHPRRMFPPPSRSALCIQSTVSQRKPPFEALVTADTQAIAGAHADGDVRILQQLLLRGAALVGGASQKPLVEEGNEEEA
ncbi:putative kinesin [Trypanosoma rangeli]|uniref:Putative kinesin n=1 Tax=Trypanosoma rangeli TaxID=5698 RepID=A0A422NDF2_TRYRA|nr:putative kinesin [Trypanosoma rangeli]RNF03501.1 putative kinesin [Trypanosoma rangeli]|eukprot:RNF03501.1 putative kinesin [Trypanosoma rangeli]